MASKATSYEGNVCSNVFNGITPVQQMASSCAGAFLVSLFMTPLDVVKIRLQTQDLLYQKKCFLYSNGLMDHLCARLNGEVPVANHSWEEICNCRWYNRPKYFNGTLDAMIKISQVEGITSLWSGLSPTLVLAVPTTVIYFTSYEQIKQQMYRRNFFEGQESQASSIALLSGGIARTWAVTVVSPLELIRTKMQSQKMTLWQVRDALRLTLRSEGLIGLWKGYTPTLYRDVPFSALYWPFYETFKKLLCSTPTLNESQFGVAFLSGALAGSIASAITLPADVIKTRRQMELGESFFGANETSNRYSQRGTISVGREILQSQGPKGLFAGIVPRIMKVAPACAIMISSYEICKSYFRAKNKRKDLSDL